MMPNFRFDMSGEGDLALVAAFALIWLATDNEPRAHPPVGGATHYAVRPAFAGERAASGNGWAYGKEPKPTRLVFFRHHHPNDAKPDNIPFPFRMDGKGAADFARRWLAEVDYGRQPDHDGDNHKGWRLYNEGWGHVDDERAGIIAVAPSWAMYGK